MSISQSLQKEAALQLAEAVIAELKSNGQPLGCHTSDLSPWGLEFNPENGSITFPQDLFDQFNNSKIIAAGAFGGIPERPKTVTLGTTKIYAVQAYNDEVGILRLAFAVRRKSAFVNIFHITNLIGFTQIDGKEKIYDYSTNKFRCPNFPPSI